MAYDLKYGDVTASRGDVTHGSSIGATPLNESHEPVFILRAQDVTSTATLLAYRDECIAMGAHPDHIASVKRVIDEFVGWQSKNSTKMPD